MSLQASAPSTFPDAPYRQHQLGFLAPVKPLAVSLPPTTSQSEDALFTFDSGRTLSFSDGLGQSPLLAAQVRAKRHLSSCL